MTDKTDKPTLRDTDKPSETAQKGLPEAGDGAAARHYQRDLTPTPEDKKDDDTPGDDPIRPAEPEARGGGSGHADD